VSFYIKLDKPLGLGNIEFIIIVHSLSVVIVRLSVRQCKTDP